MKTKRQDGAPASTRSDMSHGPGNELCDELPFTSCVAFKSTLLGGSLRHQLANSSGAALEHQQWGCGSYKPRRLRLRHQRVLHLHPHPPPPPIPGFCPHLGEHSWARKLVVENRPCLGFWLTFTLLSFEM